MSDQVRNGDKKQSIPQNSQIHKIAIKFINYFRIQIKFFFISYNLKMLETKVTNTFSRIFRCHSCTVRKYFLSCLSCYEKAEYV